MNVMTRERDERERGVQRKEIENGGPGQMVPHPYIAQTQHKVIAKQPDSFAS
jgi:hypothetical protein